MSANINPIYTGVPKVSNTGTLTAANTSADLSSGTVNLGMTAGANGSFIRKITAKPLGTNVASVARIFWNNGSATTTAGNNSMFTEMSLPAITITQVAAQADIAVAIMDAIGANERLYVLLGTAVAAGWAFTFWYGDY